MGKYASGKFAQRISDRSGMAFSVQRNGTGVERLMGSLH